MNQGTILAIIVLVAYLAFEVFAISKVSYRTEPLYIFGQFVAVDRAMALCGEPDSQMRSAFTRNRASVRQRAERALIDRNPGEPQETIDRLLAETIRRHEAEVEALVEELGCDDIELFKLKRGYENRARLNLPAPVQGTVFFAGDLAYRAHVSVEFSRRAAMSGQTPILLINRKMREKP